MKTIAIFREMQKYCSENTSVVCVKCEFSKLCDCFEDSPGEWDIDRIEREAIKLSKEKGK